MPGAINVQFDTVVGATAQNVTDLNAIVEATTGTVTGTLSGTAAVLDDLTSDAASAATNVLTITVTDAQTGAAGVTALNTIAASTTGSVTATISGNAADLDDLTATGTTRNSSVYDRGERCCECGLWRSDCGCDECSDGQLLRGRGERQLWSSSLEAVRARFHEHGED